MLIERKLLSANGVFGIFSANSADDDIAVYTDENRTQTLCTFYNLRSQQPPPYPPKRGEACLCLSDFITSRESGIADWLGVFAVTAGLGVEKLAKEYETAGDDYNAIMVKSLADRLAEAFAEWLHQEMRRKYWGCPSGIRVSHGYPACPDHSEKGTLFDLIHVRELGMNLTESFAMTPVATVSGLIFAHPQSRYFAVGKITDEQMRDYATRKGTDAETIKKWMPKSVE